MPGSRIRLTSGPRRRIRSLTSQHAEFEADRSQTVAPGLADSLHKIFRAEFAEMLAKLAKPVVFGDQMMTSNHACVQFAGRPVADETARMQQRF